MSTPRRRSSKPASSGLTINMKTLAWVASLCTIIYALNRPVEAFNALSSSVDKLAVVVGRLDLQQTDQGKIIDQLRVDQATLKADVATLKAQIQTLQSEKNHK